MSLAFVTVTTSDFDLIYGHLVSHRPAHRNMHLREACQRNNRRDLRYLHAMHVALGATNEVDGMICGPGVLWQYKIIRGMRRTQLNVLLESGSPRALARIGRRFLPEILTRIQYEQTGLVFFPIRTAGQFYLRRSIRGMPLTHRTCRHAVATGVLDQRFVSMLSAWNFELLHP